MNKLNPLVKNKLFRELNKNKTKLYQINKNNKHIYELIKIQTQLNKNNYFYELIYQTNHKIDKINMLLNTYITNRNNYLDIISVSNIVICTNIATCVNFAIINICLHYYKII
jgi:hypothetical protein